MHLCMASSIRAMPEKEKPPAMRVDLYYVRSTPAQQNFCADYRRICYNNKIGFIYSSEGGYKNADYGGRRNFSARG